MPTVTRTRKTWDGSINPDGKRRTEFGNTRKVRQYPFKEMVMQITIPVNAKVRDTDTKGGSGQGEPYREFSVQLAAANPATKRIPFIKINCFLPDVNPGDTLVATVKASQQTSTEVDSENRPLQVYGLKLTAPADDVTPTHVVEVVTDQTGVDAVMRAGPTVHDTEATDMVITTDMSLFLDASLLHGNHCGGISVTPIE